MSMAMLIADWLFTRMFVGDGGIVVQPLEDAPEPLCHLKGMCGGHVFRLAG